MDDESIVHELRRGNTSVLRYCYNQSLNQVQSMVLKSGGSKEDARDLFHDALIILTKKCREEDFTLTSSLKTYLYAICKYRWLNELKKKKKVVPTLALDMSESDIELAHHSSDDNIQLMMNAINQLGGNCKEILLDYYYAKLEYDEIAQNMGYSSGQVVRQQKYRCIKRLKEMTNYVYSG